MDYVCITTYQRKPQVESLVASIQQVFKGTIIVFQDGGNERLDFEPHQNCHVQVVRYTQNHGKLEYYKLVTDIFELLHPKRNKVGKFWMLPDDIEINPDIFTESVRIWDSIKDERKICLSIGHTHNRHYEPCWTYFTPVKMGEVVLTNWNDLCFMAEGRFLEELNYKIERPLSGYDYRSSGVGRYISRTLHNKKFNLYHTDKSLCNFLHVPTQMHRKQTVK